MGNLIEYLHNDQKTGIYHCGTPSPAAKFFVLPKKITVMKDQRLSFSDVDDAQIPCPVAYQLLLQRDDHKQRLVQQVTVGPYEWDNAYDCITVTLHRPELWQDPRILALVAGKIHVAVQEVRANKGFIVNPAFLGRKKQFGELVEKYEAAGDSSDMAEINAALELFVDGTISAHGGAAKALNFEKGVLTVEFRSGCQTCQSTAGTRHGLRGYLDKMEKEEKIPVIEELRFVF